MKKSIIYLIILILFLSSVAAELIPIDVVIDVDFEDEREFRIVLPNGASRHFSWENGTEHSDVTYSQVIYHNLDEETFCTGIDKVSQYEEITKGLSSSLETCNKLVASLQNGSVCEDYRTLFNNCDTERIITKNLSNKWQDDYSNCNIALSNTKDTLSEYKRYKIDLTNCENDLDDEKGGKTTSFIFGFVIGGIVLFFWMKKKNLGGPGEMAEAGGAGLDTAGRIGAERPMGNLHIPYRKTPFPPRPPPPTPPGGEPKH